MKKVRYQSRYLAVNESDKSAGYCSHSNMPCELKSNDGGEAVEGMGRITSDICARCHGVVSELDENTLECFSGCRETVHMRCLPCVNEDEWKVLKEIKNAMYVCDTCLALHEYDDRMNIEKKIDVMLEKIGEMEQKFSFFKDFDGKVRALFKEELNKLCTSTNVSGEISLSDTPRYNLRSNKNKTGSENTGRNVENTPKSGIVNEGMVSYSDVVKNNVDSVVESSLSAGQKGEWRAVSRKVYRSAGKTSMSDMRREKSSTNIVVENHKVNGRNAIPGSSSSFATKNRMNDSNESKKKPNPRVIIKPRNSDDQRNTKKVLSEKLKTCSVKVNDVITRHDGAVIVELNDEKSSETFKQAVKSAMGDGYEVEMSQPFRPMVKLLGITEELNKDELKRSLLDHNEILNDVKHLKLLKIYSVNGLFNAIIEVDAYTYGKLMERGKLICEWDRCRVVDGIDVLRCYKCCAFNHKGADCSARGITCPRCAGSHSIQQCDSVEYKCANCIRMLKSGRQGICVDHAVWSEQCPVYRRMKDKKKEKIDFEA